MSVTRRIAQFFSFSRPHISRPRRQPAGVVRVTSLGAGGKMEAAVVRANRVSEAHGEAILAASLHGLDALEASPKLARLPWNQVHLVRVTFAPGTSAKAAAGRLPIGVRGTQLGAAAVVRGRAGHLHAYALVFINAAK